MMVNPLIREKKIPSLFPSEDEIPERFRLNTPIHQQEYLIDGELRVWDGAIQPVYSPIYVRSAGTLSQKYIGSCQILNAKEAFTALHAAEEAYKQGSGLWPMMSISERIKCIEDFTKRMIEKKQKIITRP